MTRKFQLPVNWKKIFYNGWYLEDLDNHYMVIPVLVANYIRRLKSENHTLADDFSFITATQKSWLLGVKLFPTWPDGFFNAIFRNQRKEYLFWRLRSQTNIEAVSPEGSFFLEEGNVSSGIFSAEDMRYLLKCVTTHYSEEGFPVKTEVALGLVSNKTHTWFLALSSTSLYVAEVL